MQFDAAPPRVRRLPLPAAPRLHLDTLGLRCPNCQQQHGHDDLLDLPLAGRAAA